MSVAGALHSGSPSVNENLCVMQSCNQPSNFGGGGGYQETFILKKRLFVIVLHFGQLEGVT